MSKENEQVFKHCDSFVVLSSDEQKKQEWLEFGQGLGLDCVGCIDSSLNGQEEIYSRTPYFQGRIVGLERGEILKNSSVIKALVSDIVKKSRYGEKSENQSEVTEGTMIDDTELGFELGYGKEIYTEDGTPIKKVKWSEDALPKIYKAINEKVTPDQPVKINGIRANFALCGICKALRKNGVKDIKAYDIRTKSYIPIRSLPKRKEIKQAEGLYFNIVENQENVFLDIDITKEQYSLEDYEKCVIPKIKGEKNLYLSGRMPLWLLASISSSYDNNRIFTFQPGKGFTCISSIDEKDLGTIVNGIDGININQYFEDKKDKNKKKLPTIVEKQGILSKLRSLFSSFSEKRENMKYLDDSIKSKIIKKNNSKTTTESSLQPELQQEIIEISKEIEESLSIETPNQEVPENDIGGKQ